MRQLIDEMKSVRLEDKHVQILRKLKEKKIGRNESAIIRLCIEAYGIEKGVAA